MHKLQRTTLNLEKRAATLRTLLRQIASEYHLIKAAGRIARGDNRSSAGQDRGDAVSPSDAG